MKKIFSILILGATLLLSHSGGTNSAGCHYNHKTGDYHCHRSDTKINDVINISHNSHTHTDSNTSLVI
jgi:hypothetical protein